MSLFGWSRNSSDNLTRDIYSDHDAQKNAGDDENDNSERRFSSSRTPVALPPSDPTVLELELLLAQAKVGTHEFTAPGSPKKPTTETLSPLHPSSLSDNAHCQSQADTVFPNKTLRSIDSPISSQGNERDNKLPVVQDSVVLSSFQECQTNVAIHSQSNLTNTGIFAAKEIVTANSFVPGRPVSSDDRPQILTMYKSPNNCRFFAEEQAIPVQLNSIQRHFCRKRHEFQTRLHDLDCKIAELTAKVAEENMNLDLDLRKAMEHKVYQPVGAALESLTLDQMIKEDGLFSPTSLSRRWMALERNVSALDSQMTHSIHVQLADLKRDNLTVWQQKLDQDILPDIKAERTAMDKLETTVARRWESQAGTMARRFQEERASRVAALVVADTVLQELDPGRGKELMSQIRELREQLQQERAERMATDEAIRNFVAVEFDYLKKIILLAHPEPDPF